MPKIAIIGTTSWGKTLGVVLAREGLEVRLWARTEREAIELRNGGPNPTLLRGNPGCAITDHATKYKIGRRPP